MKYKGKKLVSALLAVLLAVSVIPASGYADSALSEDIVILFTGDVHGQADENLGFAGLAAYENEMRIENK